LRLTFHQQGDYYGFHGSHIGIRSSTYFSFNFLTWISRFLPNINVQKSVNDLRLFCGEERNFEATQFSAAISSDSRSEGGERPNRTGLWILDFYPVIEVGNSPTVIQWLGSARK
jgi:hypothetical protein